MVYFLLEITIYNWVFTHPIYVRNNDMLGHRSCELRRRNLPEINRSGGDFLALFFGSSHTSIGSICMVNLPTFGVSFMVNMGVSKNRGTPKWMVYNGNPYQNG